jgi:hypothetical protein
MKKKDDVKKIEDTNDFGFSFTDDDSTVSVDDLNSKLLGLRDMIMPLLNNLKANPEQEYIKWPNRQEKIDAFIAKMNAYIDE